jgi:hypothetical protein
MIIAMCAMAQVDSNPFSGVLIVQDREYIDHGVFFNNETQKEGKKTP